GRDGVRPRREEHGVLRRHRERPGAEHRRRQRHHGSALRGIDIANDSLTGSDIKESTLGQVPNALTATLGGIGRSSPIAGCNPDSATLITCTTVAMTLPAPSRVLLIGRVRAIVDNGQTVGYGSCD